MEKFYGAQGDIGDDKPTSHYLLFVFTARGHWKGAMRVRCEDGVMPVVHMIHGYLGVGKTTLARNLERELPAIRFTEDEWVTRIFGDRHLDPETMLDPIRSLIALCWTRCVELGLDVVLDTNFWTRRDRDEARAKAVSLGAEHRLYSLSVPEEIAWARVENRNKHLQGSWYIDRNAFETLKTLRGFDPLGEDEPHVLVDAGG